MHACGHNAMTRVQLIINGMDIFMLQGTGQTKACANILMLQDDVQSTDEVCGRLATCINHALTSPDDQLLSEVPLLIHGQRMHQHPHGVRGLFECLQKDDDDGVAVMPCGRESDGTPIVEPPARPVPVFPPLAPPTQPGQPAVPGGAPQADPNALINGMMATLRAMTELNMQADARSAAMARQQMDLQAATLRNDTHQLGQLSHTMGNLGHDVGRAIASQPPPAIQATLSHPNAAHGQSTDLQQMGSLTRPHPVGLSVAGFNHSPHAQAFQAQPNNENTRRVDEAAHQITQRCLPTLVKARHDAAHTCGVITCSNFILGHVFVVETRLNIFGKICRCHWWHSTLGTGCITSSGFLLQPNTQERNFGRHAPTLGGLDSQLVPRCGLRGTRLWHLSSSP